MRDVHAVAQKVDQAIVKSRLNSLTVMMMTDRLERLRRIAAVLQRLSKGAYLIGTGPSTVGIILVTVEEVVLGRAATPIEKPADGVVDYEVSDTMYLEPREVSRLHAKVRRIREGTDWTMTVCDLGSKCGTFVNGEQIGGETEGRRVSHGDVIALGASHTSTYLVVEIERKGMTVAVSLARSFDLSRRLAQVDGHYRNPQPRSDRFESTAWQSRR